jgi:hypothetical protein
MEEQKDILYSDCDIVRGDTDTECYWRWKEMPAAEVYNLKESIDKYLKEIYFESDEFKALVRDRVNKEVDQLLKESLRELKELSN